MVFCTTQYRPREFELDCIWTILFDIINFTKRGWGNSRCITGICDNDMRNPELHKNHSNVYDGDLIMHKLPKDGAIRAV